MITTVRMVIWTFFVCLSFVLATGNPVREPSGYDYNVKHPGGSSSVRVRTGGNGNTKPYLHKANADYISDATYLDPHYVGPPPDTLRKYDSHRGNNYNYEPYHGRIQSRPPVYVEHSKPIDYQPITSQDHYDRPYPILPQRHAISQPRYANPPFSQQTSFDDDTPKYISNKFEQESLDVEPNYEPIQEKYPDDKVILVAPGPDIVQQVVTDDIQEPSGYPDSKISQLPLINSPAPVGYVKSPINQQQILVDEPEEIPVIHQKPLEQTQVLSQKTIEAPSIKTIPVVSKSPIVQQSSLDDIHQTSHVDYMNNKELSQLPLKESPIAQQVSDGDDYYPTKLDSYNDQSILKDVVQENINPSDIVIGKSYGSPVIQTAIEEHPSQAVYDSSIEPSFSDIDHQIPSHSYAAQPKYRFVPSGLPYERISHSTEIIHGPASSPYSIKTPQKNVKSYAPINKSPPAFQSIKSPPPPVTKTAVPLELSQQQEHVDADIFLTKNPPPPPPPSVKLPPPPPPSVKLPPPPPPSVKLPPPPIFKSSEPVIVSQVQEPVDIILTKNPPPPPSVKLPPPPPATKSFNPAIVAQVQEPVDIILTKNPLPPPPVTKSFKPAILTQVHEPDPSIVTQVQKPKEVVFTKGPPTSYSVKAPPPVYKPFIPYRPPIKAPFYGHKSVPQPRVKLPPPKPRWDKPQYESTQFVKRPPPNYSVKQPYNAAPVQLNHNIRYGFPYTKHQAYEVPHIKSQTYGNPHIKYPPYEAPRVKSHLYRNPHIKSYQNIKSSPVLHGVKLPVAKSVHSVKVPEATSVKTKSPPPLKTPPLTPPWIRSSPVQGPVTKNPSYDTAPVAQPYNSNIANPNSGPFAGVSWDEDNAPVSHPEERPYHATNEGFHSEIPSYGPPIEKPEEKSPFEKYGPVSHAIRLPSVISSSEPKSDLPTTLNYKDPSVDNLEKSPLDKYPPVSHAVRLPSVIPTTDSMPNLFAAVPSTDSVDDAHSESLQNNPPPVSHAVILPLSQPSVSALRSDTLSNPVPNAVRRPLQGRSYRVDNDYDEPRQDFPAFPVESALKQKDPVSDKVSHLTRSFRPDYLHSEHEPEENESKSINDARREVARVNEEIGVSFGDRLPRRSRYS